MAVYWATMVNEVSAAETTVRYVICHDVDVDVVFKVSIVPIGADVRISSVQEEHEDNVHLIFRVTYATSLEVEVTLTWV